MRPGRSTGQKGRCSSFDGADVVGGGFAVMGGLEGQAVVKDGGEGEGGDQKQNTVDEKVFHGSCGV